MACCGGNSSTPLTPPPPPSSPPLLSRPWRNSPALDVQHLLELKSRVENFSLPPNLNVTRAKILMMGPAKAGKSSFVKTITSIFQEQIAQPTTTGFVTESLTMRYRQFPVRSLNNERPLNFCLCDTRGFDPSGAPDMADLNYLLEGNVPDGYTFSTTPIHPDVASFIHQPGIQDEVHCVAFVFDASSLKVTEEGILHKLKDLQLRMNIKDVPRIVLLTKIDNLSEALTTDVSQVFLSKDVKRAVDYVSHRLGIPPGNVMPIKNYENENMLNNSISCLALQALDRMLGYANDYLKNQNDRMEQGNT
ncbi:hypothetical protein ACJMK2_029870 [Sinanodonta woodiana]|uniref:Interferon-induced protein 44-like n=1 Tax=Sinanodonta woodiana TaxID=1069815 RepID=A0ABD3XC19_SINWO